MDITEKVELFLKKNNLLQANKTIVVAFSGGYDSMCLLNIVNNISKQYNFKIIAAHLNHNWRGEESLKEAENCEDFTNELGIEFYCEALNSDVPKNETSAREARYEFFERCANLYNSNIILTAHNADDNAETVLYRIIKGTGTIGLQGIKEQRGIYYRPLLDIYRTDIEKYCAANGLKPNIDSSNENTKYKRNFIRHKILPLLEEINPCVKKAINSLSQTSLLTSNLENKYVKQVTESILTDENEISTEKFVKLDISLKNRIIYDIFILNKLDYDREKIQNVLKFIEENNHSKSGKTLSMNTDLWLFISAEKIKIISTNKTSDLCIEIKKTGKIETENFVFEIVEFNKKIEKFPTENENYIYCDLSNFDFNFTLKNRPNGGTIQPFGMKGTQKLRKYLIDKKIPKHEKNNLLFFCKDDEILWAIGVGISEKIKVAHNPTHVLKWTDKKRGQNEN